MSSASKPTVLHYSGSVSDRSGVHGVIRQIAQIPAVRSILGVGPGFVAERNPRVPVWRGGRVDADSISPANLWRTLAVGWRVRRWLRRAPHRIFHGHTRAGLLVALWLRALGERRVAVTVHVFGRQRWFYRLARRALGSRIVWLSPAMKRYYGLPDAGWTDCIPNGLTQPWAGELRRWPGGRPLRVGGAGMMVRWKRWDLVLAALRLLPPDRPVEFHHIGGAVDLPDSREYERELRASAQEPALASRVHWHGWQESSAALFKDVDILVVSSDGEPFSLTALEALFAGVPVIATRGGGPDDFIVEGRNGWLIPAGDSAALADRLVRCSEANEWRDIRQDPAHLRQFSMPETLAARWTAFYAALAITR